MIFRGIPRLYCASQVLRLVEILEEELTGRGEAVGNTIEYPALIEFTILPADTRSLMRDLDKYIPDAVRAREASEYEHMLKQVASVTGAEFSRDELGRRAIVLHPGCITYQHFTQRRGDLWVSVHMRGCDLRKFVSDVRYMIGAAVQVSVTRRPERYHFTLHVDCLHYYTVEAPL
jgi:hypothetical protein